MRPLCEGGNPMDEMALILDRFKYKHVHTADWSLLPFWRC